MKRVLASIVVLVLLTAAGCQSSASRAKGSEETFRLGIFPNLTHAPGHVAEGGGIFDRTMTPTKVEVTVFNSGTDAGNALLAGSIDGTYIGPGPAAALFLQSNGKVAVVSGAVSGGSSFVVHKDSDIQSPEDLHGKAIAVPGIGNTQDVALRTWLHENGLKARDEGGDVSVKAVDNADLFPLFKEGQLDGAWEPEPYPSYLVGEGVAAPYLDEADLWPNGEFVTTQLLVNTTYLQAHPEVVRKLVESNVEAINLINSDPDEAKRIAQTELVKSGAPSLDQSVVDAAWQKLTFTWDPIVSSQLQDARDAYALGALEEKPTNLTAIYQLEPLNEILQQKGEKTVEVKS